MLRRLVIYIKEMFPIRENLPFTLLLFYTQYYLIYALIDSDAPLWNAMSLIGFISLFLIMLSMRVADEFKDEAIDKALFSHRPYPRGAVKKSDLNALLIACLLILLLINSFNWITLLALAAVWAYQYLTYKFFFVPDRMRDSLFMALVSHQPFVLVVNLYVLVLTLVLLIPGADWNTLAWDRLLLVALFAWTPLLAWETSRKIRGIGMETEYVTYSKIMGPKKASLLSLGFILIGIGLASLFHFQLGLNWTHLLLLGLITLYGLFIFLRFIFSPMTRYNSLKATTVLVFGLLLINLLGHLLYNLYL